jgi:indole-3-glycerol phosphate synthase
VAKSATHRFGERSFANARHLHHRARVNKLDEIIAYKREEVKKIIPLTEKLQYSALARNDFRSLESALKPAGSEDDGSLGLIAEVKRASPSAGIISEDFDPVAQAQLYDRAGASAISVLTDEKYFQGKLEYLVQIRERVLCPVLRKDFIVHEVQIYEASVAGADAVLLIVAALAQDELVHLLDVTQRYGLEALVEVHDAEEMERALDTDARIIGINNRNLKTMEVDLETTESVGEEVPEGIILVSESGIKSVEQAAQVKEWGADAILVGEMLMRSDDVEGMVQSLMMPVGFEESED